MSTQRKLRMAFESTCLARMPDILEALCHDDRNARMIVADYCYELTVINPELPTYEQYIADSEREAKEVESAWQKAYSADLGVILVYNPPYTRKQMQEAGYAEDMIQRLMNDPVHRWRAYTGIELIHREPTLAEQERIWANWLLMDAPLKERSDQKSRELFGMSNSEHHEKIMAERATV
jgi:hypothetical protein